MGIINLADAKVAYEGQMLPAINLISKLQTQLQEAASRIAAIATTLGDLQTALLNSHTVEVKLTLSKEDYGRLRSMGGMDDNERIRKAVMTVIHPEESGISPNPGEIRQAPPADFRPLVTPAPEPVPPSPEPRRMERILQEQLVDEEPAKIKKPTTKCPRCQSPIDLPEASNDPLPVEIKCGNCGAKCLVKSKAANAEKPERPGFESLDESAYGKLFDILSA
ncbi:MAG: hypothetical protein HY881_16720 [Deltaproteobacteria bacterium]|nr:hypothetical protein [Deltaproteobacteria bacterium]